MNASASPHLFTSHWPDIDVPECTLPELLLAAATDRPEHPALVDGSSGRAVGYGELAASVDRVAAGFAAHGLGKGEVVAVLAPNSPEWLVVAYGAMTAGGVVSGISPLYTAEEVAGHLTGSGARFLVTVPPFLDTARAAVKLAGVAVRLVLLGDEEAGCLPFGELLQHGALPPPVGLDPAADLAALPYSSGTSGLPKGVQLTHRACVANILMLQQALALDPSDRALAIAPFFHAVGFNVVAGGTLHVGATLVTMPKFDVEPFLGLIETHRITAMVVVPPIVLALAKHPAVDRFDLSSLRWIGCGAAPLGAELQQECARRVGCEVLQGYGMTEHAAALAAWPAGTPVVPGSAGKLLPGVSARLMDPGSGADVEPGGTGELWTRGPSAMRGYLGDPQATAALVDGDGWMHTGDVARIEADGSIFLVDRVKELIKVKGLQVAPAELEAVLRAHPGIADAAVVPIADERSGERPKAFVVRSPGAADLRADEVLAYVAERVAEYKHLAEVEFIEAIPTSPSGKTLRRLLRAGD